MKGYFFACLLTVCFIICVRNGGWVIKWGWKELEAQLDILKLGEDADRGLGACTFS